MRLPGFVAEASLLGIARSRDRRKAVGGARHFRQTPGTITPQQGIRVDALSVPVHFLSPCRQRCEDDQQVARVQCLGRCKEFVGRLDSPFFIPCLRDCQSGKNYYRDDNPGNILPGAPELSPGYCDVRCGGLLARLHIPLHFVRP